MKKITKAVSIFLVLTMIASSFAGCGKNEGTKPSNGNGSSEGTVNAEAPAKEPTEITLPLTNSGETITIFMNLDGNLASTGLSYEDTDVFKELEKRTGVHVDFQIPASGEATTAFNMMIASGELTDIIIHGAEYPDGLDAAVDDGYYLDLTPYLDNELSSYNKLRTKSDFFAKSSMTDSGRVIGVYQIYREPQGPWCGLQVRKDWLDDLGLDTPVTFDDWEVMLTKFKEEKGAYAPMSLGTLGYNIMTHSMSAGYGAICDFMAVDNKVCYGPIQDGWRKYLAKMHDWYAKGLIDPDFMTTSMFMPDMAMVTTGQTGAWDSMYTMPQLYEMTNEDKNCYIIPVPSPVENKGDEVHIRLKDSILGCYATISANAKNPELCMKWLNYICSPEGSLLCNYGIEGRGLKYDENGNPTYGEMITANPDGYSVSQAQCVYAQAPSSLPCDYDWKRELSVVPEKDLASYDVWGAVKDDYILPAGLTQTSDESKELASITSDITTYVNESTTQFITGVLDINTQWDEYVANIEGLNIARAVELKQAALDRFNAR